MMLETMILVVDGMMTVTHAQLLAAAIMQTGQAATATDTEMMPQATMYQHSKSFSRILSTVKTISTYAGTRKTMADIQVPTMASRNVDLETAAISQFQKTTSAESILSTLKILYFQSFNKQTLDIQMLALFTI